MAINLNQGGEGEPLVDINTTPLIDVMLVLLIMLIITIPVQTHAVRLDMPQANSPPPIVQPTVVDLAIDFDAGEMRIKRVKTGKYFTVPLYPKLRPLLVHMRAEGESLANAEHREFANNERVFIIDNARKALTNACERLGLPGFTQRNLRQMFIVEAYRAGLAAFGLTRFETLRHGMR